MNFTKADYVLVFGLIVCLFIVACELTHVDRLQAEVMAMKGQIATLELTQNQAKERGVKNGKY